MHANKRKMVHEDRSVSSITINSASSTVTVGNSLGYARHVTVTQLPPQTPVIARAVVIHKMFLKGMNKEKRVILRCSH